MDKRGDAIRVLITDPAPQKRLAKYLVHRCFRNSVLEDLHAGMAPDSKAGDYSDAPLRNCLDSHSCVTYSGG
ncbi:MAG: hypothetical protein WB763_00940 [Terriglobia bacterium]|jgi:hypothetical protein